MFDITKKRALETAEIELVNGDGSAMKDDEGNPLSVTIHGPGSKVWQQADAERNRRRADRVAKNRGRLSAAFDDNEDAADFLAAITVSFNGWEYPHPEGGTWGADRQMFRTAYLDDGLGYIRDHVHLRANDWSVFTRGSATS